MVSYTSGRFEPCVRTIQRILMSAQVPQKWYSFYEVKENRICIIPEKDGIHIFIPDRGKNKAEKVFDQWDEAARYVANFFEYVYTVKTNNEIEKEVKRREKDRQKQIRRIERQISKPVIGAVYRLNGRKIRTATFQKGLTFKMGSVKDLNKAKGQTGLAPGHTIENISDICIDVACAGYAPDAPHRDKKIRTRRFRKQKKRTKRVVYKTRKRK